MSPAVAASRLGWSLLLGAGSGLAYDMLHPPQLRRKTLADLLFMLVFGWFWLVISFAVCGGDIRMGCYTGQLAGLGFWEWTVGRSMRVLLGRFWKVLAEVLGFLLVPGKNILKFVKVCQK